MKIEEVLAKVIKGEELTADEKAFAEKFETVDVDAVANSRAATARKDAEKKTAELQTQLETMKQQMDELRNKDLTADEKAKQATDKLLLELETVKAESVAAKAQNESMSRQHEIDKIYSGIKVINGVSPDLVRSALASTLTDVDLTDKDTVKTKIDEFITGNQALIAADTGGGSGSTPPGGVNTTGKRVYTRAELGSMSTDEFTKNEADIYAAKNEGRVTE